MNKDTSLIDAGFLLEIYNEIETESHRLSAHNLFNQEAIDTHKHRIRDLCAMMQMYWNELDYTKVGNLYILVDPRFYISEGENGTYYLNLQITGPGEEAYANIMNQILDNEMKANAAAEQQHHCNHCEHCNCDKKENGE